MKKLRFILALLLAGTATFGQSDFYVGDWDMEFIGTPQGDAKMKLNFTLDGSDLKGTVVSPDGEVIEVSNIETSDNEITIYFTIQGYDVNVEFEQQDADHLKGSLMGMFDAKASRKMAGDYYAGKWKLKFIGTPNGDAEMTADLKRVDGTLQGELSSLEMDEPIQISSIEEDGDSLTLYFTAQGYDVNVVLKKEDADHMKGSLMEMFDATAERMKE